MNNPDHQNSWYANSDGSITVHKEAFNQISSLAEAVMATKSYEGSQEYQAAKALQETVDFAIEEQKESIIFDELEVNVISALLD